MHDYQLEVTFMDPDYVSAISLTVVSIILFAFYYFVLKKATIKLLDGLKNNWKHDLFFTYLFITGYFTLFFLRLGYTYVYTGRIEFGLDLGVILVGYLIYKCCKIHKLHKL